VSASVLSDFADAASTAAASASALSDFADAASTAAASASALSGFADAASTAAAAVAGQYAADALAGAAESGRHAADDPYQYDYTVPAVYHHSAHAYTNHNCPNAVYDPMSASCYRDHCSVSGNSRMARSEYIPAVQP